MTESVDLRRGTISDLASLEPLWVSLHHHHAEAMPELAPYVDDRQTWAARSALYAALLVKPETVLLLAGLGGALVGYGLAHVLDVAETWVADTWRTEPRIGEIESLAVLASTEIAASVPGCSPGSRVRSKRSVFTIWFSASCPATPRRFVCMSVAVTDRRGPTSRASPIGRPAARPGPDALSVCGDLSDDDPAGPGPPTGCAPRRWPGQ
jgi:hypothetical protein